MLGLDPEGPIPLDVLCILGAPTVQHIVDRWTQHGHPTPISGDPHFGGRPAAPPTGW
ncbi:hypothetical protein SEA_ZAGIE_1 [Microbacterium phage Zagie]|nr:hypothetical protein SEA_ZAGIE_1 [Microbacterium phage Zagie]